LTPSRLAWPIARRNAQRAARTLSGEEKRRRTQAAQVISCYPSFPTTCLCLWNGTRRLLLLAVCTAFQHMHSVLFMCWTQGLQRLYPPLSCPYIPLERLDLRLGLSEPLCRLASARSVVSPLQHVPNTFSSGYIQLFRCYRLAACACQLSKSNYIFEYQTCKSNRIYYIPYNFPFVNGFRHLISIIENCCSFCYNENEPWRLKMNFEE
jgi:hypothetical protein